MNGSFDGALIIGIDGCKKGWCCSFGHNGKIKTIVIETIDQVKYFFPYVQHILIDIPIGLESKTHKRDLDRFARKQLSPGPTSAIFTPPAREALNAADYREACDTNFEISGKKISIQSWNISKKILEVDTLICQNASLKRIFHECHPEICFKYLNNNRPLASRKHAKSRLGIEERLRILSNYHEDIYASFQRTDDEFSRNELKADDIVDSFCLFVVGKLGALHGFSKITGTKLTDEHGIDLCLHYFDTKNLPHVENPKQQ
jgi:predicted RNase H-like nuclease